MIYELFTVGGFWFWAIVCVSLVWLIACVKDEDNSSWAIPVFLCIVLWLFGDVNVFKYIWQNPVQVGLYFLGYIGIGVIYSFVKWAAFLRGVADIYYRMKSDFINAKNLGIDLNDPIPEDIFRDWIDSLNRTSAWQTHSTKWVKYTPPKYWSGESDNPSALFPSINQYKSKIIYWMSFWPISLLWLVLNDFFDRIFHAVFDLIKSIYQGIANRILSKIIQELRSTQENK